MAEAQDTPKAGKVMTFHAPEETVEVTENIIVENNNNNQESFNNINNANNASPNKQENGLVVEKNDSETNVFAYKKPVSQRKRKPTTKAVPTTDVSTIKKKLSVLSEDLDSTRLGEFLRPLIVKKEKKLFLQCLNNNADPNGGNSGVTPLYTAVDMGLVDFCGELLNRGASMVRTNIRNDECALQLALKSSDQRIVDLFLDRILTLENHSANVLDIHPEQPSKKKRKLDE